MELNISKETYEKNIGKKVRKHLSNKPFKSGKKVNTVKSVINHPILNVPAYTFYEDNSYVECRRCEIVNITNYTYIIYLSYIFLILTILSFIIFIISVLSNYKESNLNHIQLIFISGIGIMFFPILIFLSKKMYNYKTKHIC